MILFRVCSTCVLQHPRRRARGIIFCRGARHRRMKSSVSLRDLLAGRTSTRRRKEVRSMSRFVIQPVTRIEGHGEDLDPSRRCGWRWNRRGFTSPNSAALEKLVEGRPFSEMPGIMVARVWNLPREPHSGQFGCRRQICCSASKFRPPRKSSAAFLTAPRSCNPTALSFFLSFRLLIFAAGKWMLPPEQAQHLRPARKRSGFPAPRHSASPVRTARHRAHRRETRSSGG